jgi:hypothetical protein
MRKSGAHPGGVEALAHSTMEEEEYVQHSPHGVLDGPSDRRKDGKISNLGTGIMLHGDVASFQLMLM